MTVVVGLTWVNGWLIGEDHLLELANKLGAALSPAFDEYPHGMPDKDYDIVVRNRSRLLALSAIY